MANTVVGFFDSSSEAQDAVEQLVQNGFSRDNIDVSASNATSTTDTEHNSSTSGSNATDGENGITRFFKNLFGDNDEADRYSKVGQRSGAIVSVHTQSSDEAERAADLLDDYGAVNVDEKASEYGYSSGTTSDDTFAGQTPANALSGAASYDTADSTTAATDSATATTGSTTATTGSVIPVVQEELEVGKRTVETGGVRVRSRIVERPVEESIRLREEKVTVERTPVNRAVTDADLSNFTEKSIELTETAEVPVVNKQARVVEEVRISKDATEREETIHDTVRNTEVDVENIGTKTTNRSTDADYDTDLTTPNTNTL